MKSFWIYALLAVAFVSIVACGPQGAKPEARRDEFATSVLAKLDLASLVAWARARLSSTNSVGAIFPPSSYPKTLKTCRPVLVQLITDTQTADRFVLIAFRFGPEREGLMIGAPGARINNYGYRSELTNGVFYVLDHN